MGRGEILPEQRTKKHNEVIRDGRRVIKVIKLGKYLSNTFWQMVVGQNS